MLKKISLGILLVLALLITIPYIVIGAKDKPITDDVRAQAPGQFAQLTDGKLHYTWFEPATKNANGQTVVMLHGLYVPQLMFISNAQALAGAGYRVLLVDHFGHGYSDRPSGDYTRDFFAREVNEILEAVHIDGPIILAGQSMGGLIATQFTAAHPEKVDRLILFVPAGLEMHGPDDNLGAKLLRTPVLGEWLWRVAGRKAILAPRSPPCDVCGTGELLDDVYEQAKYKGYFPAMLNILRNFTMRDQDIYFEQVGQSGVPVLAIFGKRDETVHIDSAARFKKAMPGAQIIIMPDGDHAMNIRHDAKVNAHILAYLSAPPTPNDK